MDKRMPRPAVGCPQAKTTGSVLLYAISTVHTVMSTSILIEREILTKIVVHFQAALESGKSISWALLTVP